MADDPATSPSEAAAPKLFRSGWTSVGGMIAALVLAALVVLVAISNRDRDAAPLPPAQQLRGPDRDPRARQRHGALRSRARAVRDLGRQAGGRALL
jgi:hypothetical protein